MALIPEILHAFSVSELARICHVSPRTARRWKQGTRGPPETALMILRGDLGAMDPAWSDWVLRRGLLCSPEDWSVTPGDVRAMQLKEAQVSALRREVFALRAELHPQIEDQPLPTQWEIGFG